MPLQSHVPGRFRISGSRLVLGFKDLEAHVDRRLLPHVGGEQVGRRIRKLDAVTYSTVDPIVLVKTARQTPVNGGNFTTRLQQSMQFVEHGAGTRRVANRLERVGSMEVAVWKTHCDEILKQEATSILQPGLPHPLFAARNLAGVAIQAGDACAGRPGYGDHRSADAATHIGHFHARLEAQAASDAFFVPTLRSRESLATPPR